ncbi:MAG TPA: hypothetical protein VN131_00185 [Mobilitalea sp.]|nr:hypothetical protein [Mobilitalea sp.]
MANRDIKKEVKKKKKSDISSAPAPSLKPMMSEPELIKKSKKNA